MTDHILVYVCMYMCACAYVCVNNEWPMCVENMGDLSALGGWVISGGLLWILRAYNCYRWVLIKVWYIDPMT